MIKDRLPDMKAIMKEQGSTEAQCTKKKKSFTKFTNHEDSVTIPLIDTSEHLFINLENKASDKINQIKDLQEDFKNKQETFILDIGSQTAAASISKNFIQLVSDADKLMKQMKQLIDDSETTPTIYKMRQNIYTSLLMKLKTSAEEFDNCIGEYSDRTKEHLQKQMKIVGYDISELDNSLDNPENFLFTGNFLKLTLETQKVLQESTERYEELKRIENDITELRDMFVLMSIEVEKQGEKLDSIEQQVISAAEYVTTGESQLNRAKKSRDRRRKTKIICSLVGVTILIIIAIILIINLR